MWSKIKRQAGVMAIIIGVAAGVAGCAQTNQTAGNAPGQSVAMRHGMVKLQALVEAHPDWVKLRQLEEAVRASELAAGPSETAMDIARQEYEAAMKIRQNADMQALEQKEAELQDTLNKERQAYIEQLEAEYRSQLFDLDLKLQTVQYSPAEKQKLQTERARLEAERQQKLQAKDKELQEKFTRETDAYASSLKSSTAAYADEWMRERGARMRAETVASPDLEKQKQELNAASGKMMQDIKRSVAIVAEKEKLDMVWIYPAVRQQATDITDLVKRELTK